MLELADPAPETHFFFPWLTLTGLSVTGTLKL